MAVVPVDPQPTAPAEPAIGVRLDPSLSFEAWRLLGAGLSTGFDESCWALGDWVAFGRARYGRFYRDALFATGLDHATLGGYAAVARRFTPARRRADVSFRHHAEVWAVEDDDVQSAWLAAAAAGRWSWKELHRRLRAARGRPARRRRGRRGAGRALAQGGDAQPLRARGLDCPRARQRGREPRVRALNGR